MGRSTSKLNELINGKAPLTVETAKKLEYVLGIEASFWLNLEKEYQEELLKIEQLDFLEDCKLWLKGFPLAALKKMNLLPDTRKREELIEPLLQLFRVASPKEWKTIYAGASMAFKIDLQYTKDPKAISTWLRIGELQTEKITLQPFDKKILTKKIPDIQEIAYLKEEDWLEQLQAVCASFGVALVYTPCISKAPIYGASRWIKNKTIPIIQITDRQKDYNAFWFTFYHELGHIRYHNKSDIFINGVEEITPDEEKEKKADDFAVQMLFSTKSLTKLKRYFDFSPNLIKELSQEYKIHQGIIVAQLQRKGIISYKNIQFNRLKPKVEFKALVFED